MVRGIRSLLVGHLIWRRLRVLATHCRSVHARLWLTTSILSWHIHGGLLLKTADLRVGFLTKPLLQLLSSTLSGEIVVITRSHAVELLWLNIRLLLDARLAVARGRT